MSVVVLKPGGMTLAGWRRVWAGEPVRLDPACHDDIQRAAEAVSRIVARGAPVYGVNTGFGKLASVRIPPEQLETLQRNIVLSHSAGVGEPLDPARTRMMMALKLASLARGASGVRLDTVALLEAMLARDILPVVPEQGSVGASGDLAPLAHMTCALIGIGDVITPGGRRPAAEALADAGLSPLDALGPKEGLALLNGTQFSAACALAGLFEAERLLQASLVTSALSTEAARGSDSPFDHRIHALRGHAAQIECAAVLRELMSGSAIRASHVEDDTRVQDPYCLRCMPQVAGAALTLLRQAGATLEVEANGVSDNPLIFPETDEAISGGNFHAEPVAFAADMVAMALCEIGSISERRTAMLVDPALSGLPAFLTPEPGLNSGFMMPQVTAAALVSENKQMAYPASVDSIPTSANQEDHVSMAAHGARRLTKMAANAAHVLGIELLAAAQGCDFHAPLTSSPHLEALRRTVRTRVPGLQTDRLMQPDMEAAAALIRSGEACMAVGLTLPGLERA